MSELICIDPLWVFVGGNQAREEAFSTAHIFKKTIIHKAETACRCAYARFYKPDFVFVRMYTFTLEYMQSFKFEVPDD